MRFLFGRHGGQLDHQVRLFDDLAQHRAGIVGFGVVSLEQLPRRQHHLVRGLSPSTAAAHTVGQHGQHATAMAGMVEQANLILLVVSVPPVDAGGCLDAVAFGHVWMKAVGGILRLKQWGATLWPWLDQPIIKRATSAAAGRRQSAACDFVHRGRCAMLTEAL